MKLFVRDEYTARYRERETVRSVEWAKTNQVRDYMTRGIVTSSLEASLLDVERLLMERRLSRVVVVDSEGSPVGIISEKDIVRFTLTDKTMRGFEDVQAKEAMTCGVINIKPDASMAKAAQTMIRMKTSSLMVKDDEPEGVLTKTDMVSYLCAEGSGLYSVGQFMTPNPVTVNPTEPILSTIELMSKNAISRIIVVGDDKKPLGIITLGDFSQMSAYSLINLSKRALIAEDETPARFLKRAAGSLDVKAEDFMTQHLLTLGDDSDLADAAGLMTKHDISGLPVTDDHTNLVGVISKTDITRAAACESRDPALSSGILRQS
jgi:CBS domain-containing protein